MGSELVHVEIVEGAITLVTLDNPPVNAHSEQMLMKIAAAFDTLSDRDDVRVAILTGAGKVFCAGADIKALALHKPEPGDHWRYSRAAREAYHSIRECRKPVIAALNGPALGGGLAIAASCDILVAAETAVLGLPEIDVGLLGGGKHAQRLFGHSLLRRMMLTGYRVAAAELYRRGIVEACLPPAELLPYCLEIARELSRKDPITMSLAKGTLNTIEEMGLRDGYRFEQSMTAQLLGTKKT